MNEDVQYVRKTRVMRMENDCDPCIAIGLEGLNGDCFFFSMADATAFDLMRRMTSALFDAEPSKLKSFGEKVLHE
jgi:hypothetical protein